MTPAVTVNIASHLAVMADRQPDMPAVIEILARTRAQALVSEQKNYAELDELSNALARGLLGAGAKEGISWRGTRVALCVRPGIQFFALTFGLFKLGAVPVLIDPGIGVKNFGQCLAEAEPAVFIGTPLAHLLRRTLRWARRTVRLNISTGWFGGESLLAIGRLGSSLPGSILADSAPDDPAAILFTSGSTGPPKGVVYTHANFQAQVRALRDAYNIQPGEIDLATFPLFGLFGPALGMTTVVPKMDFTRPGHVDPLDILKPIKEFGVTNLFGSPALLDRVGQWGVKVGVQLPTLRRVISAGAPVPATVIERFASMLAPGVQVFTPYGATESLPVASIGSDEILHQTRGLTSEGKGVCVGRPVAGTRVRIIKITDEPISIWSDELELPRGEIGEIVVQGPVVTRKYFGRPEATRLAKIADPTGGFYHRMGDVGYFDKTSRLWFCGRKSQRVRLPGGDLFSAPFEEVFNAHPMVARSALVGVMRDGVVRPVICVESREPFTGCEIGEGGRCLSIVKVAREKLRAELRLLAGQHDHTRIINDFLFHPGFPVDIRHNAKIGREKLAVWAARKLP